MSRDFSNRAKNMNSEVVKQIFGLVGRKDLVSFAGGNPSEKGIPIKEIEEYASEALKEKGNEILQYGNTEGFTSLRELCVSYAKRFGIENITYKNVILTSGGQQAIDIACKIFVNEEDVVLVEDPTYLACLNIIKSYKGRAVGVDTDEEGISICDLEKKIKEYKPKLIYLVSTFANPTGKTMSEKRRQEVCELTAKYNIPVLEDDPYRDLRFAGKEVKSIKSFDKCGNVIYVHSFSKVISPSLRIAFVVADEDIIDKYTFSKETTDVHDNGLAQAVVEKYLEKDKLLSHIEDLKEIYRVNKECMIKAIEKYMPKDLHYTNPDGGFFIWCWFDDDRIDFDKLFFEAVDRGVKYVSGHNFYADESHKNTFRLTYSNATEEEIDIGIKRLADLIKEKRGE